MPRRHDAGTGSLGAPWLAAMVVVLAASPAGAQTPRVASRTLGVFPQTVVITSSPQNPSLLFFADRNGYIRLVDRETGAQRPSVFLDINASLGGNGDGGLVGLALAPDFDTSGFLYTFTTERPDGATVISRWRRSTTDPFRADPASRQIIFRLVRPVGGHTCGWLEFGPDGMLYAGLGDSGDGVLSDPQNASQTIVGEFRGKILRLDVSGPDAFPADANKNYAIPPGNPFVGRAGEDEIWAYGVRNPWRNSFDTLTGELYIADVGQDLFEEINVQPRDVGGNQGGRNYGWRCMEGPTCTSLNGCPCPGTIAPVLSYDHSNGCSISGGHVYRGSTIPSLQGVYLYGDYCSAEIGGLVQNAGQVVVRYDLTHGLRPHNRPRIASVAAFGRDASGEIYIIEYFSGRVHRIVPRDSICIADVDDGSGTGAFDQGVGIEDLLYYLGKFAAGAIEADVSNGNPDNLPDGGVTIEDLLYYLERFTLGC